MTDLAVLTADQLAEKVRRCVNLSSAQDNCLAPLDELVRRYKGVVEAARAVEWELAHGEWTERTRAALNNALIDLAAIRPNPEP